MRRRLSTLIGAALVLSVLAACGGDDGGGDTGTGGGDKTVRFVFSPDPVWNWLEDQGILAQMEQESGYHDRALRVRR